jgi:transposase
LCIATFVDYKEVKNKGGIDMKQIQTSSTVSPRQYDIFAGMDVDSKSIAITFSDHMNKMKSIRIPSDGDNLKNYVAARYAGQRVVFGYEVGPTGFGLYDALTNAGYHCIVAPAANIPKKANERVKTNRLDSKKISENLRSGQLTGINVPTMRYRHLRHLTQLCDTFIAQLQATKNRIRALLVYEGIRIYEASVSASWSTKFIERLRQIPCSEPVRFKLDRLIDSLYFYQSNIKDTVKTIRTFCKTDPELNRNIGYISSTPGIGFITASQFLARIGDWRFLTRVDQIGSFLGLVPSEHSTGDTENRGNITRLGNKRLRSKLIQCAWVAIRIDPGLREFYQRIRRRNHIKYASKKAIVAVARKLTTRIYAVLTQQRMYRMNYTHKVPEKYRNVSGKDSTLPRKIAPTRNAY